MVNRKVRRQLKKREFPSDAAGSKSFLIPWALGVVLSLLLSSAHLYAREMPSEGATGERKILSFFWREGCGHCKREKEFLYGLQHTMPHLELQGHNIDEPAERELFEAFTNRFALSKVTPIAIIGRKFIVGFDSPETTGAEILKLLREERADLTLRQLLQEKGAGEAGQGGTCPITGPSTPCGPTPREPFYLNIPFLGSTDLARFTLPVLSMVLGLIDGFNPCAMAVLVTFLTALVQVGSTKKMIQFAGVFILAEVIMYFLILNSWFLAFDFIGADQIVTPLIGGLAVGGGIYFLWEFSRSDGSCKISNPEKRARTYSLIHNLCHRSFTPLVILGILGLAFSVNVVEFACSIGIPQAYTKILDINRVGLLKRELLMGIYIFFYMIDDLVVFALAIWSVEKIGLTTRYSRASNLLGGIIMILLGLLLIFAPQKLHF